MKTVTLSFVLGGKTISLGHDLAPGEELPGALAALLAEAGKVVPPNGKGTEAPDEAPPGKASIRQLKALYAKAAAAGWDKERVRGLLKEAFGTAAEKEIVGQADRRVLSRLIDSVASAAPDFGTATEGQLKALWAKALARGWDRDKVKTFLREKLKTCEEKEIVGRVDRKLVAGLIAGLAA